MLRLHATCVAVDGAGVLLRGPSGAGKSDLALRLIDGGAVLVADDQVIVSRDGDRLIGSPPPQIAGRLEVRGLGILRIPALQSVPLLLVVELVRPDALERLPEPRSSSIGGIGLRALSLSPFECSAAAKVRLAVRALASDINACPDPASSSVGFVVP